MVCWGSNQYLEKGGGIIHKLGPDAATIKFSTTPVAVDLGKRVIALGMSYESTYAVTEDGMAYAWGYNGDGYQLGTGSTEQFLETPSPVMVDATTPLTNVVELTRSDGSDMCARIQVSDAAHYVCWGGNDLGELGSGVRLYQVFPYADAPTLLPESASSLVRGEDHGCAIVTTDGRPDVWCWGKGQYTGNGSLDANAVQPEPAAVKWDAASTAPPFESP
jgi:alpha-tubulin suppressor-like RCC1 family protein